MWKRITTPEQVETIDPFDTILRYTHAGPLPEVLTGPSYADNYEVKSVSGESFSIQLIADARSVQSLLNATFPTRVSIQSMLQEGNWYLDEDKGGGRFINP